MTIDDFALEVEARESQGSGNSRRFRGEGRLPSVIYSKSFGVVPILLNYKDFVHAASKARTSQVFTLKSEDKKLDSTSVVVKDIQTDYVSGKVLHVDFQALTEGEKVKVRVPLNITGEATGVKNEGGVLTISCREVVLRCRPGSIPEQLGVDIAELRVGERVRTGDLPLPDGVVLVGNPQEVIAGIVSGRLAKARADAAEAAMTAGPAEEGGEGEAAAAGEGAPAAEGGGDGGTENNT